MAKFIFKMPDVGEGVAEAEVVEWHVKVGDRVEEDQHLVDVMTDKATIDIESPVSGTVVAVAGDVGDGVGRFGDLRVGGHHFGDLHGAVLRRLGISTPCCPSSPAAVDWRQVRK